MTKIILPRGIITEIQRVMKGCHHTACWVQRTTDNDPIKEKLVRVCGHSGRNFIPDIILHRCNDSVDRHSDGMSKSCYVIPVSVTGEWVFHCDYRAPRKLIVGDMIKFNDYNRHSLEMVKSGTAKFYTVSFVKG